MRARGTTAGRTVRRLAQALAGVAISAGALWLTLRGKDLHGIWEAMCAADYGVLAPYAGTLLLIHLLRTVRWGLLLEPAGHVPFGRLNAASAVGFMALVLLPFRLGELARPLLVADGARLRVSSALSSVVVERVVDGLFAGVLLVVALLFVPETTPGVHVLRTAGVLVSVAFAVVLAFLVLGARNRAAAVRVVERLARPVSPRLAARAAGMADAFIRGLGGVPRRGKLAAVIVLTALYWAVNGYGMRLLATGFDLRLSFHATCTVLGVLVAGVMIPAGPGMVGTFQGAVALGLALFVPHAVVATRGLAYANVLWAAQIGVQTAVGVAFLFSRHVQVGRIFGAAGEVEAGLEAEEAEYRAAE